MYRKLQYLSSLGVPKQKWFTNPSILSLLLYRKAHKMPSPWFLQIEPVRGCNLSCQHCITHDKFGKMDYSTFKRILDDSPNARYVKLQGLGEPLLNTDLAFMAMYAHEKGCRVEVISNGTFVPPPLLLDYVDTYVISMETCDPKLYAAIRGVPIDHCIETLEYMKNNFEGKIGINSVLTDDTTEGDLLVLREFADQYGAFVTTPMMQNWLSPGVEGYEQMRELVQEAIWAHPGKFGLKDGHQEKFCQWCFNQAYYDYQGRLHPCCIRMSDQYDLGKNWNGLQMQTFRKERSWHSFCKNCPL